MKCPHCGGEIDLQSKGGKARAASLTKAQRSAIAKKAAAARWKGRKKRKRPTRRRTVQPLEAVQPSKHA